MESPTDGPYREHWSNGRLAIEGQYVNGLQEGEWRYYDENGTLYEIIHFTAGREVVDWEKFFHDASASPPPNDA